MSSFRSPEATPPRLTLAHLPTPLAHDERLSSLLGVELWVKRDDMTGGAEAGNKIRKLEFLFADALARGARRIITCGGIQSNHARATAILARRLGLECVLLLRVEGRGAKRSDEEGAVSGPDRDADPKTLPLTGNVLLDRLAGARIRTITPADYARRNACMMHVSEETPHSYVIPEGGSNGLGAFGYVEAMREVREQKRDVFDVVVHACGSGGTAAGVALGCALHGTGKRVHAVAVCDDAAYFERAIADVVIEARAIAKLPEPAPLVVDDRSKGPRYAVMDAEQRAFLVMVARESGLVLDPVYTGKAMFGLRAAILRGDIPRASRVLFLHTGGLPGLLADGDTFHAELA
ncbi:MAG TPA: D-cysteine desulfhydrase family protein [Polyangiaceae bacterium]|jgi:D-cysteine desulfhydrase|nr:D-cysteine desulfhydrase family protein [Polyangiaceae bacterium]